MKSVLPNGHGLTPDIVDNIGLLPRDGAGAPSITDVQYDALSAGVAQGKSMICVAPTSTGKTLIGIWALLSWLGGGHGRRSVYLVTHRALANQKFEEFCKSFGDSHFSGDLSCIVLASGDAVVDGNGSLPPDPINAPLLVATYEKYLAMLAGSGVRGSMTGSVIVCDEVQIIGDAARGRSVEVLLTLLKRAGWGQLIALSAVLDTKDATSMSDWLGVKLIRSPAREKHLKYECRTSTGIHSFDTEMPAVGVQVQRLTTAPALNTADICRELMAQQGNKPVVVFCMVKERVYDLAASLAGISIGTAATTSQPLLPGLDEDTTAARELSVMMARRVAFHTADLRESERRIVETALEQREVDVVVATSTLAAGVNFPLGAVIFDSWKRWDSRERAQLPIPASEFHNMAGRAGRMGSGHIAGRVVYVAEGNAFEQRSAALYLDPDKTTPLTPRLGARTFSQVALQLVSSGLCPNQNELRDFLLGTYSAHVERDINKAGLAHWDEKVSEAITALRDWGYVF